MTRTYLSPPHMGPDERRLLIEAFDSNWIAPLGPHVDAFESEMVDYLLDGRNGADATRGHRELHALALASGTAALHLALLELGVGPGNRVLCSSLTFCASANVIRYVGAEPAFVDTAPECWNIDSGLAAEELGAAARAGRPYKAVVVAELYGDPCDIDPLRAACERQGAALIEDAAEALGAEDRGRRCGSLGDVSVLSFNGNKILTTGGGGMLVSPDAALVAHARKLSTQAREPTPHYEHEEIGYNYRLSNLLAAVGRGQLRWLDDRVAAKRKIRAEYERALADVPGVSFVSQPTFGKSNAWLTVVQIDPARFGADREVVRASLEALDIECRPAWKPMHLQPLYRGARFVGPGRSQRLFEHGLCLPSGSSLTDDDQARVIEAIRHLQRTGSRGAR